MARTHGYRARLSVLLVAFALLGAMGLTNRVSADTGGVTVSGETVATLDITIADATAEFGTNLSPDGTDSNSGDGVTDVTDTTGACYIWDSSVTVASNVDYAVTVEADVADADLSFMTSNPGNFAACIGGTSIPDPPATAHEWVALAPETAGQAHPYYLTMPVLWTENPGALPATALTFTVAQDA
jgi:hypothetical protein